MTATVGDVARGARQATAHTLETTLDVVKGESFKTKWDLPPTLTYPVPEGVARSHFQGTSLNARTAHAELCLPPSVYVRLGTLYLSHLQLGSQSAGDYRDQLPPLIHEVAEQYAPVVRSGRWTHGLFELSLPFTHVFLRHAQQMQGAIPG